MKDFLKSFFYAYKGIFAAIVYERNLKVQTTIALVTIGAGLYFKITQLEWCILLLTIGLVLSMELINTAIEKTVDLITLERNPLAGKIKDIAAAAVLVVAIIAAFVGAIIFSKYFF